MEYKCHCFNTFYTEAPCRLHPSWTVFRNTALNHVWSFEPIFHTLVQNTSYLCSTIWSKSLSIKNSLKYSTGVFSFSGGSKKGGSRKYCIYINLVDIFSTIGKMALYFYFLRFSQLEVGGHHYLVLQTRNYHYLIHHHDYQEWKHHHLTNPKFLDHILNCPPLNR